MVGGIQHITIKVTDEVLDPTTQLMITLNSDTHTQLLNARDTGKLVRVDLTFIESDTVTVRLITNLITVKKSSTRNTCFMITDGDYNIQITVSDTSARILIKKIVN